ncbi:MAG: T9SS type A sorting domain-containing protein [Bacteroidetes bacterium]|nr:T9SS type A sorting domain-containing protein [Bacteroidota bacterium]
MKTRLQINITVIGTVIFLLTGFNLIAQETWEKSESNPVLTSAPWSSSVASPVVIFEDDTFKMWFGGDVVNGRAIGYAESPDGINWVTNVEPVIQGGNLGDWDASKYPGSVIRINDTLKMWYSGSSDNFGYDISIGYAWSLDNIDWYVLPNKVLEHGDIGTWEETGVFQPVVYYDGTLYHMWYGGFEGTTLYDPMQEGYATSTDGIYWVKDTDNNPVITLGPSESFYDTWVIGTSVLYIEDKYYIWFAGWDGLGTNPFKYWSIGYATSLNGSDWIVENADMPVIDYGEPGEWDDIWARYCSVLIHEDQLKMWYDGKGYGVKIGYATDSYVGIKEKNDPLLLNVVISPNPFYTSTTIEYNLKKSSIVQMSIFNHLGKQVDFIQQIQASGQQQITWNALGYPSGVYYFRIQAGEQVASGKMLLMK